MGGQSRLCSTEKYAVLHLRSLFQVWINMDRLKKNLRVSILHTVAVLYVRHCAQIWHYMDRVKRIWYLSPMRAAKVQASLRIRAVSPEPSLLAHRSSDSTGTFRQKARSLAPLNGWTCAVKICHDGMLEDTNSLDGAHIIVVAWCRIAHYHQ